MRDKILVAVPVTILVFVGLLGVFDFPAVVSFDRTFYPRDYHGNKEAYEEKTTCLGVPLLFRSCETEMVKRATEQPGEETPGKSGEEVPERP